LVHCPAGAAAKAWPADTNDAQTGRYVVPHLADALTDEVERTAAASAGFLLDIDAPVLAHGRRQLLWVEVTRHPTAEWLARQITEAFPWASTPTYLVRDNDGAYGHVFSRRVVAMGIRDRPISPGSPWQNGHMERLIGTVRRECLDRVLIFGEAHLRRILTLYASYYNESRTHLSLNKDAPMRRAVQRSGIIIATPVVGGLHHRYVRI
jgi:transposase InsO family protein